jgi:predicted ATP-grasp superfamily ATP-dependent carboligase/protein-tyrosine-phosphatase
MINEPGGKRAGAMGVALVLDGHSRAALETLQSLGRRGVAVDVASEAGCLAYRSRYCRNQVRQPPPHDPEAFVRWLEGLVAANQYRLLVPSTETSLRCLLPLSESHHLRRIAVLPSTKALEIALSKQMTWQTARSLGIPVPMSRLITTKEDGPDLQFFPLVLKPAASLVAVGGRFIGLTPLIVRTRKEWVRGLDRLLPLSPVLEQEHVAGGGVGIECLYRNGSCVWHFQHERLHELPLTGGGSSYRRSTPVDKRLLSEAMRILDSLGWHGVAMVEFKGSPERGFRLMEINPRLWGSLALAIDAGVDFPDGLWRIATGANPGPQPSYRWPHYTRNLEMDIDWLKENLRADHSDPLLLTKPKLGSFLEYGRALLGKESWDHFDLRDWRVWSRILRTTIANVGRTAAGLLAKAGRPYFLRWRHRRVLAKLRPVRRVLFVCYGNICRSPLAELYARKLAPNLEVASTGFHDTVGRSAPDWYRSMAAELGVDLSASRSKRMDGAQVEWAQLILLADLDNLDRFEREFPNAVHKATLLGLFSPTPRISIEDPYNLDPDEARLAARDVMTSVEGFVTWSRAERSRAAA